MCVIKPLSIDHARSIIPHQIGITSPTPQVPASPKLHSLASFDPGAMGLGLGILKNSVWKGLHTCYSDQTSEI